MVTITTFDIIVNYLFYHALISFILAVGLILVKNIDYFICAGFIVAIHFTIQEFLYMHVNQCVGIVIIYQSLSNVGDLMMEVFPCVRYLACSVKVTSYNTFFYIARSTHFCNSNNGHY